MVKEAVLYKQADAQSVGGNPCAHRCLQASRRTREIKTALFAVGSAVSPWRMTRAQLPSNLRNHRWTGGRLHMAHAFQEPAVACDCLCYARP
jgi:hypothetical protein